MSTGTTVVRGTFQMTNQIAIGRIITHTAAISLPGVTRLDQIKRFDISVVLNDIVYVDSPSSDIWTERWGVIRHIWLSDYDEDSMEILESTAFDGGVKTFHYEAEIKL